MKTGTFGEGADAQKYVMRRVAENLYRLEPSGGYYALLKRRDKQFRRSLKTKDRKLADRRLTELRAQVGDLTISEDARLTFAEIAQRWLSATAHALKESTVTRRKDLHQEPYPLLRRNQFPERSKAALRAMGYRKGHHRRAPDDGT